MTERTFFQFESKTQIVLDAVQLQATRGAKNTFLMFAVFLGEYLCHVVMFSRKRCQNYEKDGFFLKMLMFDSCRTSNRTISSQINNIVS